MRPQGNFRLASAAFHGIFRGFEGCFNGFQLISEESVGVQMYFRDFLRDSGWLGRFWCVRGVSGRRGCLKELQKASGGFERA